jgi:hypothetical protein
MPYPCAYKKTKDYLKNMLKQTLVHIEKFPGTGPELLRMLGPVDAAHKLKNQLEAFWRGEYPFIISEEAKGKNPLEWWQHLEHHMHARILASLAIRIFSILVNSMPDERTNSTITWFNSAIRGNQSVWTIVDMIQVGQWYGKHVVSQREFLHRIEKSNKSFPQNQENAPNKERYQLVVKFRKIDKATLNRLQYGHEEDGVEDAPLANADSEDGDGQDAEGSDGEGGDGWMASVPEPPREACFEIDDNVDINSRALIDMISKEPLVSDIVWREIGPAPNSPCKFASASCGSYFAGLIFG